MGWTYAHKSKNQTTQEFFTHEFEGLEILDCAVVKLRTAYLAVRSTKNPNRVMATVCLLDYKPNDYFNFGYKDMSEDAGPYRYECPARILALLTDEFISEEAIKWRETCRANLIAKQSLPKLTAGLIVRSGNPLSWRKRKIDRMMIISTRGSSVRVHAYFEDGSEMGMRTSRQQLGNFTVLSKG